MNLIVDLSNLMLAFMVFCGLMIYCSMRKHLLVTLLGLEFLTLSLFYMFFVFLCYWMVSFYFILVFLTFVVCESAVGLGVLVSVIRVHGNDMISSMSILGW